jgi:hypothetical protein
MPRPTKLTMERQIAIVEWIRKGAFNHIAAEANSITSRTFDNWMRRGRNAMLELEKENGSIRAREYRYLAFFLSVRKAHAECRAEAEHQVLMTDPRTWLRAGPGRPKPDLEGWMEPRRVEITGKDGEPVKVEHVLADALQELEHEELAEAEFAVVEEPPKLPAPKKNGVIEPAEEFDG